jgi:hypothetical protein
MTRSITRVITDTYLSPYAIAVDPSFGELERAYGTLGQLMAGILAWELDTLVWELTAAGLLARRSIDFRWTAAAAPRPGMTMSFSSGTWKSLLLSALLADSPWTGAACPADGAADPRWAPDGYSWPDGQLPRPAGARRGWQEAGEWALACALAFPSPAAEQGMGGLRREVLAIGLGGTGKAAPSPFSLIMIDEAHRWWTSAFPSSLPSPGGSQLVIVDSPGLDAPGSFGAGLAHEVAGGGRARGRHSRLDRHCRLRLDPRPPRCVPARPAATRESATVLPPGSWALSPVVSPPGLKRACLDTWRDGQAGSRGGRIHDREEATASGPRRIYGIDFGTTTSSVTFCVDKSGSMAPPVAIFEIMGGAIAGMMAEESGDGFPDRVAGGQRVMRTQPAPPDARREAAAVNCSSSTLGSLPGPDGRGVPPDGTCAEEAGGWGRHAGRLGCALARRSRRRQEGWQVRVGGNVLARWHAPYPASAWSRAGRGAIPPGHAHCTTAAGRQAAATSWAADWGPCTAGAANPWGRAGELVVD